MRVEKIRIAIFSILAIIISIASWGQIMVLRQTDGTERRFFAGNIKEIVFESEPEVIEGVYDRLEVKAFTGNFILSFSGEGMPDLSLDVYTDRTSYLPEGLYPVSHESSVVNAISGKFTTTYVSLPTGRQKLQDGYMKVSDAEGDYTITMEFEAEDGTVIAASYSGALYDASRYVKLLMHQASWKPMEPEARGGQIINMMSANGNAEVEISIYSEPEIEGPTPGIYTPSEEMMIGTYLPEQSVLTIRYPHRVCPLQGDVEIGGHKTADSVECRAGGSDGRIYLISYSGNINQDSGEEDEPTGDEETGGRPLMLGNPAPSGEKGEGDWEYSVNVICSNGNIFRLSFDEMPKVELKEGEVCISAGDKDIIRGERDILHKLTISREERSGLREVEMAGSPTVKIIGSELRVEGLRAGETLMCYTMEGILVGRASADETGAAIVVMNVGDRGPLAVHIPERGISFRIMGM
ncbi:MAG: hypothetical protein K2M59_00320 [Muribaculaceae bacterium]|nr:hypothetical protein [Muribaculaceae bacterium]